MFRILTTQREQEGLDGEPSDTPQIRSHEWLPGGFTHSPPSLDNSSGPGQPGFPLLSSVDLLDLGLNHLMDEVGTIIVLTSYG